MPPVLMGKDAPLNPYAGLQGIRQIIYYILVMRDKSRSGTIESPVRSGAPHAGVSAHIATFWAASDSESPHDGLCGPHYWLQGPSRHPLRAPTLAPRAALASEVPTLG